MHRHVAWHKIKDKSHVCGGQRPDQAPKSNLASKFGINHAKVDDIVAVRAAGA